MAVVDNTPTQTLHLSPHSDTRGVVYVEFLIAFIPVFLLFLSICQLALIAAAKLVVCHAANTAARSAIVVLEDPVDDYKGAPRGNLTKGSSDNWGWYLPIGYENYGCFAGPAGGPYSSGTGARMSAIRTAAVLPLFVLAPKASVLSSNTDSLQGGLVASTAAQLGFAYCYTNAATSVTLMRDETSDVLASEPIDSKGSVTARVAYIYHCSIPIARGFMCNLLASLIDTKLTDSQKKASPNQFGNWNALNSLTSKAEHYVVLTSRATLPNQGAGYVPAQ